MSLRILTFGLLVFLGMIVLSPAVSADSRNAEGEFPLAKSYDFQSDPFLLDWTFKLNADTPNETPTETPVTYEDKILSRWKEKQPQLWSALPSGKFSINASAYTAAADECGKNDGVTSSGLTVEEGRTLACPPQFPFGAKINIEGIGIRQCEDRGGAIQGNHFDVYMTTKMDAFAFGRQNLLAEVVTE